MVNSNNKRKKSKKVTEPVKETKKENKHTGRKIVVWTIVAVMAITSFASGLMMLF